MKPTASKNQYLATIVSSLGPLCFGLLIGWLPPILPLLLSKNTPLEEPLTLKDTSWVASLEYVGKLIGTFIFAYIVDIIGRKPTMCISILPILVGNLLVVFARTSTHINLSRFFMGFGGSGCYVSVPVYVAEISEIRNRGRLGAIVLCALNMGITIGIVLGALVPYYLLGYILLTVTSVSLLLVLFLPESPVFLQQKGKKEKADKNMFWFQGITCEENGKELQVLTENCKPIIVSKQSSLYKYKELMTSVTLKGLFIGIMIFVFQQGSGYFPLLAYSSVIFEEAGSSFLSANLSILVVEVWKNIAYVSSNLLIEKAGRRFLLLISSVGVVVSLFFIGLFLYLKFILVDLSSYSWMPLVAICSFTILYSLGFGVVPYVIVTEIFSTEIKATGVSICIFFYGLTSFFVSLFFSSLALAFGWHGCFWFFAAFSIVGTIFIWLCVPETKQRPTEDILRDLLRKRSTFSN